MCNEEGCHDGIQYGMLRDDVPQRSIPPGYMPIQRCDSCGLYRDDADAAKAAGGDPRIITVRTYGGKENVGVTICRAPAVCKDCGSWEVEMCIPAWFRPWNVEKPTDIDVEAKPLSWACSNCGCEEVRVWDDHYDATNTNMNIEHGRWYAPGA